MRQHIVTALGILLLATNAHAQPRPDFRPDVRTGATAMQDWRGDAPSVIRRILSADLPPPYANRSASNSPSTVSQPQGAALHVPPGFAVRQFAAGLRNPRIIRVAPNGDIFVAETSAGRITVLRAADGAAQPDRRETFATNLDRPFGIAFYPPGPNPRFVYVAGNHAVQRFAYNTGDLQASGPPETVVAQLSNTAFHHTTRDIAFSSDGRRMFVSVGSSSNVAESMPHLDPAAICAHDAAFGLGAAWGDDEQRADVLVFDPEGHDRRVFATGIRNCVGLAVPAGGSEPWCATNERDGLGDDTPPDYVTRVQQGKFYGWPWYYIGAHEDPRHRGERPDLAGQVTIPDVLIQAHSAALGMVFYPPAAAGPSAFPPAYRGDAFVALHGSWNRARRTGYKVVRLHMRNGVPDGTYEDFLTGFVVDDSQVWGRPVGVAVAHDGALLVTEDGNGTVWRVTFSGAQAD